jgi:drug/metabolite transporter (DMT)-like permease
MNQRRETTIAILLFVLVLLGNVVIFSIVPFLSIPEHGFGYHAFQIMLCYSAIATICMLPWALKQGLKGLKTTRVKAYGARALLEYGSFTLSFYSLSYLGENFTLPMHTALNFITPIFATIGSILILKERSGVHTWIALIAGIIGVIVITRPGMIPLSPGVLYVLGAAIGFSLCGVVIKLLCSSESPKHIAFYMLAMTTILALPAGITHWKNPSPEGWFWLALIGVIAYTQQILVAKAIAKVPYMVLIPLNFSSLVFSTILGYAVYAQVLDHWTLIGALIILASTIYNAQRNRMLAAREALIAQV